MADDLRHKGHDKNEHELSSPPWTKGQPSPLASNKNKIYASRPVVVVGAGESAAHLQTSGRVNSWKSRPRYFFCSRPVYIQGVRT